MSSPTPDTTSPTPDPGANRQLVWASPEVRADLVRQVQPLRTRHRRRTVAVRAVVLAYAFTWLPAFLVFAVATVVAPSLTDGASLAATAFWALQFATLIAISTVVTALRGSRTAGSDTAEPDEADADTSTRRTLSRLVGGLALSGLFAGLVLAVQGLSVGQIAVLSGVLAAVLHLLPVIAARLLAGAASRRLDR